jgi:hypothetical protein
MDLVHLSGGLLVKRFVVYQKMNSVILELLRGFRIAYDLAKLVEVKTYGRKRFAFFVFVYCKRLKEKFLCSLLIYSGLQ